MASETVASDHTSTHEQFEKKLDEEAYRQKNVSLSGDKEGKHDKSEDAQGQATSSSKAEGEAEGYEKKAEHAVVEAEKSEDSPALEASAKGNVKHDKVEDAKGQGTAGSSSTTEEGEAKGDKKTAEPAVVEKIDGSLSSELSVADNLKEKEFIPDSHVISVTEPSPDAAKSQPEEAAPTEPIECTKTEEGKQPKTADIPEASAETVEKLSNAAEGNPLKESEVEIVKESELETSSQKVDKPEPVVTKVQEKSEEPEKEPQYMVQKAEQPPNIVAVSARSAETNEKPDDAIQKPEAIVTDVHEKSEVTEKESQEKPRDAEQPNTAAIPDPSAETSEKVIVATEVKTRGSEFDAVVSKETNNYEAVPTETEKAEPLATEIKENSSEPEKQSLEKDEEKQLKTVIHQTASESAGKQVDIVELHPPKESDIEAVKETGNSNLEAVHVNVRKPETVSTEVEEKPRKELEGAEIVHETSKETSDDTIKEPISSNVEKSDKVEETSSTGDSAQVTLSEEAQEATENLVESSPAIAEKVKEDGKKEFVGVLKGPKRASIDHEAKTDFKEEREHTAPISVEEKVAANDDKKQLGAADAVEESSREVEVEIKNVEENNEAKTATTETSGVKAETVKDDRPTVDTEKQGHPETKVDEVRETLASKLEEKEEESIKTGVDDVEKVQTEEPKKTEVQIPEPPTKESDATKTSKDLPKETPVKPPQKHSNNIISKMKQSLVRAKKAITGKSPTSKTISEAKGDIKVK